MSRYRLETNDESAVFVGWDNPLQSFFCQKFINYDTKKEELVWNYGNKPKEIPVLEELIGTLSYHNYKLDDTTLGNLTLDYRVRTEPTPLQKQMIEFVKSLTQGN